MRFKDLPLGRTVQDFELMLNDFIDFDEVRIILEACSRFPYPRVLEIGMNLGKTTANIARFVRPLGGTIVGVDVQFTPNNIHPVQAGETPANILVGSEIPEELLPIVDIQLINPDLRYSLLGDSGVGSRRYDVIFIDGNHSVEGVKTDYEQALTLIRRNGIILFHDVWWDIEPPPVDGPLTLIKEIGGIVINKTHVATDSERLWDGTHQL